MLKLTRSRNSQNLNKQRRRRSRKPHRRRPSLIATIPMMTLLLRSQRWPHLRRVNHRLMLTNPPNLHNPKPNSNLQSGPKRLPPPPLSKTTYACRFKRTRTREHGAHLSLPRPQRSNTRTCTPWLSYSSNSRQIRASKCPAATLFLCVRRSAGVRSARWPLRASTMTRYQFLRQSNT